MSGPVLSIDHLHDVGRAVLGRLVLGESARVDYIPSTIFSPEVATLWKAAGELTRDGEPVEAVALTASADPKVISALLDYAPLISSAERGIQLLADYLDRRRMAGAAERLAVGVLSGDGESAWSELVRTREDMERRRGGGVDAVFGKPASLSEWRSASATDWLVEGVLLRGGVTFLSSRGGLGKSFLIQSLLTRLAAGEHETWLGAFPLTSGTSAPVIGYAEAECGTRRFLRRWRELVMGGDLTATTVDRAVENFRLFSAESLGNRAGALGRVETLVRAYSIDVLCLDPLRSFLPEAVGDENDNRQVGDAIDQLVAIAKKCNIAVILADHDSKAGLALRGASAKADAAEVVWHLSSPDPEDEDYLELKREKVRDAGGPSKVTIKRVRLPKTEEGLHPVGFEPADSRTISRTASRKASDDDKIIDATERHHQANRTGATFRTLQLATGLPIATLHRRVKALAKKGLLHCPDGSRGVYPAESRPTHD